MMIRAILSGTIALWASMAVGRQLPAEAHFSGHVQTDLDSISLKVSYLTNYITGDGEAEKSFGDIKVGKNGAFTFSSPPLARVARVTIWDNRSAAFIVYNALVDPGDNIKINAHIRTGDRGANATVAFSGKGASRFTCASALDQHRDAELAIIQDQNKGFEFALADSVLKVKLEIIDSLRNKMAASEYQTIRCDVVGLIYHKLLEGVCGEADEVYGMKSWKADAETIGKSFDSVVAYVDYPLDSSAASMSLDYVDFLYTRGLWQYVLAHQNDSAISFSGLCHQFTEKYRGVLRDKLLAYTMLNDAAMMGVTRNTDCDEYTSCLKEGVKVIETPWIRDAIIGRLRSRGKGAPAYAFTLPADSSGKTVSLSSFRGKVVMVDIWGYQCTGCTAFAQAFHKAIYPLFKDDTNFKVISILGSETAFNSYLRRLRSTPQRGLEHFSTYTYPSYVNLFAGKGVEEGRKMARFYNLNSFPFVFLIDKKGRIYSSTLPFFEDTGSLNIQKLIEVIEAALSQPS